MTGERPVYINGRFLCQSVTGVQRTAMELVSALDDLLDRDAFPLRSNVFTILAPCGARCDISFKNISIKRTGRLSGHLWEQIELPFHARDGLLLNFCNTGPLLHDNQIVTIHDASVFAAPGAYSALFRLWYKMLLRRLAAVSKCVLTTSLFSRTELMTHCNIREEKIRQMYPGSEHTERFRADSNVLTKNGVEDTRFVLAVGGMSAHKNYSGIIKAAALLHDLDIKILITGKRNGAVFNYVEASNGSNVKEIGFVGDDALKALYQRALCLVFPSHYEGFGLPPVEAMACGCPVVVSRTSALPEVCGEAALYCDPRDPGDIADKIRMLYSDDVLRGSLIRKGYDRSRRFTWADAAARTADIVRGVLNS